MDGNASYEAREKEEAPDRIGGAGGRQEAAVYARADLKAGQRFAGPAIVTQDDCTTCVLGGFTASVDPRGNLILTREG